MNVRARVLDLLRLLTRRRTPVQFPDWGRVEPVSRSFGHDRGCSIVRHYIGQFLAANAGSIQRRVLEVAESRYTRQFGGGRVTQAEILHIDRNECPAATIVGDLTRPETLPEGAVDCFVCTETYNCIYDVPAAVRGSCRLLRPGGVLLATMSGITQVSRYDMDRWGDFWRMTPAAAQRLFAPHFAGVTVSSYGNALAATALLQGLAVEDLPDPALLDRHDPDYPVLVCVVARKGSGG